MTVFVPLEGDCTWRNADLERLLLCFFLNKCIKTMGGLSQ